MPYKPDLSISLLSFNTKDLLENCLNSIYKNTKKLSFEILLVDNNSRDGTPQMVEKEFPKVKLTKNNKNLLFIKGHNQNLRRTRGRYFLMLNEDTEIGPGVLKKMVEFMDKNPKVGLASPRQIDEFGQTDTTCSRLPKPIIELLESSILFQRLAIPFKKFTQNNLDRFRYKGWDRKSQRAVEVLPGSFIMGQKKLLDDIGILDEDLLFFYGEPDLCQRAKKAGYTSFHNGKVSFKHLGSKAISKWSPIKRFEIVQHDILIYYKKYFGFLWWLVLWIFLKPDWLYWRLKSTNLSKAETTR